MQRAGKTTKQWSVSEYRFEARGDGFRLIVTPISSGTVGVDPERLAIEKRIGELINQPFVLLLDLSGVIVEMENADKYWSTITTVMTDALASRGGETVTAVQSQAIKSVKEMYEKMPAEVRLGLLTEQVQPALEFGDTETKVGEPISTAIEGPSPFGGMIKRDVVISLTKIANGHAYLSAKSTIPRKELDLLMASLVTRLATLPAERRRDLTSTLDEIQEFHHDTSADYEVGIENGLLESFRSTETVKVGDGKKVETRTTVRSLERVTFR